MNANLFSAAAVAAMLVLLPLQGRAQTTYTDNASNYANGGYAGKGANTPGFGAFNVTSTGTAGTFVYTASESEGNRSDNGAPKPGSIDTPNPTPGGAGLSFGLYAQGGTKDNNGNVVIPRGTNVTIQRAFNAPPEAAGLATAGDMFSVDFVKGYNDGGTASVSLLNAGGSTGALFYNGSSGVLSFNGTDTGNGFKAGADHLVYTLTSPTDYTFTLSGADTYTSTGTFTSPITGFQVQQTDSGANTPDHNAYFNNLSVTANSPSAAPEPSQMGALVIMGLGLGGLLLRRRVSTGR